MAENLLWLPAAFRAHGLVVDELLDWEHHVSSSHFSPQGIIWHDTVTGPNVSDGAVDMLIYHGRSDLAGPLYQLGLRRDGSYAIASSGRANHNGYGHWGNDSIGIGAYNDGRGEPWPAVQVHAFQLGSAIICDHYGWSPISHILGHKESDPHRKIDPVGLDMPEERAAVDAIVLDPTPPGPGPSPGPIPPTIPPTTPPATKDDEMFSYTYKLGGKTLITVQVACGKQTRIDGQAVAVRLTQMPTYLGEINDMMYARYTAQYGKVLGT